MRAMVVMSLLACWSLGGTISAGHTAEISVEVASGRTFVGQVDPASDEQLLWLRWTRGTLSVVRPLEWGCVTAVTVGQQRFSSAELQTALAAIRQTLPIALSPFGVEVPGGEPPMPGFAGVMASAELLPLEVAYRQAGPVPRPPAPVVPVASLEIDVRLANWDGDAADDGLLVEIRPRDACGVLIAVEGTLCVDLVGKRKHPVSRPRDFLRLGRTTLPVHVADFGLQGATYRVPFGSPDPAQDTSLIPQGLVHVELSVPGQGVVEATDAAVDFRPYRPFRDQMEQAAGWGQAARQ